MITLTIDNKEISVPEGTTIIEAARSAGLYIPVLCSHPDLPPFGKVELSDYIYQGENKIFDDSGKKMESIRGCGICKVQLEGQEKPIPACKTAAVDGMVLHSDADIILKRRKENLSRILADHPHACLTCSQQEGCTRVDCSSSVPVEERCCDLLGKCEIQKIANYVGIAPETPRYKSKNIPVITTDPLFVRDYNLCISCGRCVRVCQAVKGVYALGAVINNGKLVVGTINGPTLNDAECKFCGSCVEVCPTGALQDNKQARLGESDLIPCRASCPGNVNIPLYLKLVEQGKYQEAGEVISSALPLPSVLGKICFEPCADVCRRGDVSENLINSREPAGIRQLKDFAMSRYSPPEDIIKKPDTGKKVSIIGGGPAGLTAAYFLALNGHDVTIYEANEELGGMLRYGIPRYRLSTEVLDADIKQILKAGIKVKKNTLVGRDISVDELADNGNNVVFVSVGLQNGKGLPNFDTEDKKILNGIDFLSKICKSEIPPDLFNSKTVIVIGGGNVALDAARSAIRLKAEKVIIVCLEAFEKMPAYKTEIEEAMGEGVEIIAGWGIENILTTGDSNEIQLKKCTSVFNDKGEFKPEFEKTTQKTISADSIIVCIGQEPDKGFFNKTPNLTLTSNSTIKVAPETLETGIKGVFAGGDIIFGPASVIDAVGSGKKAARAMDKYLGGSGEIYGDNEDFKDYPLHIGRDEGFACEKRVSAEILHPEERIKDFIPVEQTLPEKDAILEASRCLRCDQRTVLKQNPLPPEDMLRFANDVIEAMPEDEGVVQLMNDNKEVFLIKGSDSIKRTLLEYLQNGKEASYFKYDIDPMFTKRESELIQQHLQKYGEMPTDDDELDDLF